MEDRNGNVNSFVHGPSNVSEILTAVLTLPRWDDLAMVTLMLPSHYYCCSVQTTHLPLYKDTGHRQPETQFHQVPPAPQLCSIFPTHTHAYTPARYFFGDASHFQNAKGLARNSSSLRSYHPNFKKAPPQRARRRVRECHLIKHAHN